MKNKSRLKKQVYNYITPKYNKSKNIISSYVYLGL